MSEKPLTSQGEDAESAPFDADHLVKRHGVSAGIGRPLNLVASAGSVFILARLLAPEEYGQFVVMRTAVSILGMLAAFGLETTALRLLGTCLTDVTTRRRRQIMATIGRAALLTSLSAALIGAVSALLFGPKYTGHPMSWSIILVIALGTIASGGIAVVTDSLRGIGRPGFASLLGFARGQGSSLVHVGMIIVLSLMTLLEPPTWETALIVYVLVVGTTVAGAVGVLLRTLSRGDDGINERRANEDVPASVIGVLTMSWPVAVSTLFAFLTVSCDLFLTSNFASTEGVGPYVAARRVIMLLSIPMSILNQTSRGIIAPMRANAMDGRLEQVLRSGATLISIPCILGAVVLLAIPEFVLWVVLGPGYHDAAILLQILIPGQIVFVMTGACLPVLELTGHQRTIMKVDSLILAVMLLGGVWVSSSYGAIGLAILFSGCTAARNLLLWAAAKHATGINTGFGFRSMPQWRTFLDQYRSRRQPSKTGSTS